MSRAEGDSVMESSHVEFPEPFTPEQMLEHWELHHAFRLLHLRGIQRLAVHRFMHRDHRTQIGIPHSHLENQGKRGWLPRSFSPNGVRA